jgi:hypothetical protein
MAISSGLHKIRSSRSVSPATVAMLANTEGTMQAPQDDIEEGERINGFWTACSLLKNLAVTLDPPSNSCVVFEGFGMDNIDTPWPLDMESYEAVRILNHYFSWYAQLNVLGSFITGCPREFHSPKLLARFGRE